MTTDMRCPVLQGPVSYGNTGTAMGKTVWGGDREGGEDIKREGRIEGEEERKREGRTERTYGMEE